MKSSQTYRAVLIATHTINSAPEKRNSALRGLTQRFGLAFLVCALVIGATVPASAGGARDEAAVRSLADSFAKAFVQKNAERRASLFAENGTFLTPTGDFLQGRVAMVKEFGPEASKPLPPPHKRCSPIIGSASSSPMSRSLTRSLPCATSPVRMGSSSP